MTSSCCIIFVPPFPSFLPPVSSFFLHNAVIMSLSPSFTSAPNPCAICPIHILLTLFFFSLCPAPLTDCAALVGHSLIVTVRKRKKNVGRDKLPWTAATGVSLARTRRGRCLVAVTRFVCVIVSTYRPFGPLGISASALSP